LRAHVAECVNNYMNIEKSKSIVRESIVKISEGEVVPTDEMNLIGKGAGLDSLKLVELCLTLEDKAQEIGFEFDWTSETAMSQSRSLFRTVTSLAEEFLAQSKKDQ
jgi:acyl carrier protein